MMTKDEDIVSEQPAEFAAETPSEQIPESAPSETKEADALRAQLAEAQKIAESSKDQLLRKAAEFENYKRRTDADSVNLVKFANERLMLALLPIVNDFVRSLKSGREKKDYDAFYKGVELIHNNFIKVLEREGLTAFDSVGKPFDVQYHDALMQLPKNGVEPNTVIEEIERGYKLNDKIIRHAKVIVSAPNADADAEPTKEEAKN
jgi:molecular chaperone GrpE